MSVVFYLFCFALSVESYTGGSVEFVRSVESPGVGGTVESAGGDAIEDGMGGADQPELAVGDAESPACEARVGEGGGEPRQMAFGMAMRHSCVPAAGRGNAGTGSGRLEDGQYGRNDGNCGGSGRTIRDTGSLLIQLRRKRAIGCSTRQAHGKQHQRWQQSSCHRRPGRQCGAAARCAVYFPRLPGLRSGCSPEKRPTRSAQF
jgi:hypothetical protein